MKTQHVKVVRPFLIDGKPKAVNEVIEVAFGFAVELRSGGKVAFVAAPVAAAPVVDSPEIKPDSSAAKVPQKGVK